MNNVLFCIPLKPGHLPQFKACVASIYAEKKSEWQAMLARYDISSVKIWHKALEGREYAFVYHDIGPNFPEKIQGWENSTHPFDQWFKEQIMAVYDTSATNSPANGLLDMVMKPF